MTYDPGDIRAEQIIELFWATCIHHDCIGIYLHRRFDDDVVDAAFGDDVAHVYFRRDTRSHEILQLNKGLVQRVALVVVGKLRRDHVHAEVGDHGDRVQVGPGQFAQCDGGVQGFR